MKPGDLYIATSEIPSVVIEVLPYDADEPFKLFKCYRLSDIGTLDKVLFFAREKVQSAR